MKKILPLIIVGLMLLSGIGTVAITVDNTSTKNITSETIRVSAPSITDEGAYVAVHIDEAASCLTEPGRPSLPVITKVLTFPFGTTISHVDVRFSNPLPRTLSKKVLPASQMTSLDDPVLPEVAEDPSVYDSAALFPTEQFSIITAAGLQGTNHVVYLVIRCYPLRYNPYQNTLYYSDQIDIQVTSKPPATPVLFPSEYQMVIIAPSSFSSQLQPLIDHKDSVGLPTMLKTTEDIYNEYNGFDNAEKIKYFIKDAIETYNVSYVLLVGGIQQLPIRTTMFIQEHHGHYWNQTVLTDLYYADIYDTTGNFSSWDSNGNGIYGEIYDEAPGEGDIIDFFPDVNIGRLACVKKTEVSTVVKKIISYETETAGQDWFWNIILVGGDTFPGNNGNEGEQKNLLTEQIMSEFTPTTLWTSDGTFSAHALNQAINKGAGFIDYAGHGFEFGVGTHAPNNEEWIFYQTHNLLGAFNRNKLPIIFFDACLTERLDFNFSDFVGYVNEDLQASVNKFSFIADRLLPTFGWNIVKKKNGGAIATIGATRTAFGGIDMGCGYLSLRFFEAYNTSETVSEMLTAAQTNYLTFIPFDRFTVQEFILIGDPSLKIGGY